MMNFVVFFVAAANALHMESHPPPCSYQQFSDWGTFPRGFLQDAETAEKFFQLYGAKDRADEAGWLKIWNKLMGLTEPVFKKDPQGAFEVLRDSYVASIYIWFGDSEVDATHPKAEFFPKLHEILAQIIDLGSLESSEDEFVAEKYPVLVEKFKNSMEKDPELGKPKSPKSPKSPCPGSMGVNLSFDSIAGDDPDSSVSDETENMLEGLMRDGRSIELENCKELLDVQKKLKALKALSSKSKKSKKQKPVCDYFLRKAVLQNLQKSLVTNLIQDPDNELMNRKTLSEKWGSESSNSPTSSAPMPLLPTRSNSDPTEIWQSSDLQ